MPKLRWDQYLSLLLVVVSLLVSPAMKTQAQVEPERQQLVLIQPADIPTLNVSDTELAAFLDSITADAVFVTDEGSGSILVSKNADVPLYPASTTKIMTALVAREQYYLTQVLTINNEAFAEGNTMNLQPGEQISVTNLLHGLLIRSGNDAAEVLANNHPEGPAAFVTAMNAKAKQLGLHHTNFSNASGLDGQNLAMSAHDLAIVTREVLKDPVLLEIMGSSNATVTDASGLIQHQLAHTHQLLYSDQTALAGKTGTTDLAKQVLVTKFRRPDLQGKEREVIVVVMGSLDRYADTNAIVDWIYMHTTWQSVSLTTSQGLDQARLSLVD